MNPNKPSLRTILFRLTALVFLLPAFSPLALANEGAPKNNSESRDLVAPYGYFPMALGPAPGPYTTHYLISNADPTAATVNVKCYNDGAVRVGPAAGVNISLPAHNMAVQDPVSLGLTTHPSFTGFGWCYFAETAGLSEVAVTFLVGVSVGGNLITTNNSRVIASGSAQNMVTSADANVPYWTREGSWNTYIVALNPTTTSRTFSLFAYNTGGTLQATWSPGLAGRDMDLGSMIAIGPAAVFGHADIDVSGRGFVGWVSGLNFSSGQAFLYSIALDKDFVSDLVAADRP